MGVFTMSTTAVIYPLFSQASARGDYKYFKNIIRRSIVLTCMILLPFTLAVLLLKQEVVMAVFSRGAFDETAMDLTTYALNFYILGVIPFSIREILVRGFFALQDAKFPMIDSIITAGINIALNIIFIKPLGIAGLGLATSLAGAISVGMLLYRMKKKLGRMGERTFFMDIFKIIISSIIMGVVVLAHKNLLSSSLYMNLVWMVILGLGTYLLAVNLLDIKEFKKILENIKKKT